MTELVQLAVAGSDEHPDEHGDAPVRLLVPADELDAARDAIEALTEPDDPFPG